MLLLWFIRLKWRETVRSTIWQRNLAANIGIGFVLLLMMFYLLMLGIFLGKALRDILPDRNPAEVVNSVLIYYFLFDLLVRYLMQGLPTFSVESYLHLPVRKSSIAHFILLRSWLHMLNFLPLLVLVPFAITTLSDYHTTSQVLVWLISVILLIFANGFLATWLKRMQVSRAWVTGLAALVLAGLAVADHFELIKLSTLSARIFQAFPLHTWMLLLPASLAALAYFIQYRFLLARMYPDEVIKVKSTLASDIPRIKYLESLGLTGDLIMLEIKLWWRHRRTKTLLYLLPLFILYGFFFYPQPDFKQGGPMLIFVGIFMSGGLMMNYLNYAFGYESNYFDGILTRRVDMKRYIQAKLTIGMLLTSVCYILTVPYVFFGMDILLINTATFLFNLGFVSFILLYLATYNKMRIDLSKSSTFNYQGVSAMNWLVMFPALLLPVLIYAPFSLAGMKYLGMGVIGLIGVVGFLSRKYLVTKIIRNFFRRKYIMAEGFRE